MDNRLREIERQAALGDPEAQVALLVAKNRAGEIPWERISLAAWLEDDLAKQVVGNQGNKASSKPRRWARGLAKNGGEEASARAVVVMYSAMAFGLNDIPESVGYRSHRQRYAWYNPEDEELHPSFGMAASGAMRWLDSRSDDERDYVLGHVATYRASRNEITLRRAWRGNRLPLCYLDDVLKGGAAQHVDQTLQAATTWLAPSTSKWGRGKADKALRKAIVDDLIPWALRREKE